MTVTNARGVTISRARSQNILGDNIFFNTPYGRALAAGAGHIHSIEASVLDPREMALVAGDSLYQGGRRVGSVLIGTLTDDAFASRFAAGHLRHQIHAAFYTNNYGIFGSSIINEPDRKLFNSYFYPNTSLADETNNKFVRVPGRGLYFFRTITFPGLESSPGGMVLLIPLTGFWIAGFVGILLPALIFMLIWLLRRRRSFLQRYADKRWHPLLIIGSLAVYFFFAAGVYTLMFYAVPELRQYIYPLYNSVLRFQPEGGIFDKNHSHRVAVILDSGQEPINAISMHIAYNPLELEVQSVDMERSICQNFILSEHNSQTGQIIMECIIPNPGFKGNSAVVADLYVKARPNVSAASISFLDETQVLANDGLGTDVLRMTVNSRLQFAESSDITANKLLVFSSSHPNSERWYASRAVSIAWSPAIVGSILTTDSQKNSANGLPPLIVTLDSDGVHTLPISAYAPSGRELTGSVIVRIDSVPPDQVTLDVSEKRVRAGSLVRFRASGHDALSGLQRVFYLKINNEIFFPIGSEVYVPFPKSGLYAITLRVYDKAGNYKDTTQRIIVTK